MKSEGKDKEEKGREQELTGEGLAKRIYVENLWSIRDLFADSCSWQGFVSSYCVLTLFLHWFYKMKYSCYQHSFVILGWLVYWFVVEKCAEQQKEIGNHRFLKKPLLVSLLRLARCVRRLKSLSRFWPYLMSFRAASRPVSVSNNIAFDFFFLVSQSRVLFMPYFKHICKI